MIFLRTGIRAGERGGQDQSNWSTMIFFLKFCVKTLKGLCWQCSVGDSSILHNDWSSMKSTCIQVFSSFMDHLRSETSLISGLIHIKASFNESVQFRIRLSDSNCMFGIHRTTLVGCSAIMWIYITETCSMRLKMVHIKPNWWSRNGRFSHGTWILDLWSFVELLYTIVTEAIVVLQINDQSKRV